MLTLEQTLNIMDEMAQNFKLDPNIYKYLKLYPDEVLAVIETQRMLCV